MKIVVLLDPEVSLSKLNKRSGPFVEWFDSYVIQALRDLNHEVILIQHDNDIRATMDKLTESRPTLVFNLAQHACGREQWSGHIPAMLDFLGLAYTGSGAISHALSGNKATAKRLMAGAGFRTPGFEVVKIGNSANKINLRFPVIVKLLCSGGSTGLIRASLCRNHCQVRQQIDRLHTEYEADAICEEFIAGQEVSVTTLGNKRLRCLPLFESNFRQDSRSTHFLTERIKWNQAHRNRSGVRYRFAELDDVVRRRVLAIGKTAHRLFEFQDYGNIDLRITSDGEIYFLDGNANPGLRPMTPEMEVIPFNKVIAGIVAAAMSRRKNWRA